MKFRPKDMGLRIADYGLRKAVVAQPEPLPARNPQSEID